MKRNQKANSFTKLTILAYLFLSLAPLFWVFISSLKEDQDIFRNPLTFPSIGNLHWENYLNAWSSGGLSHYLLNTCLIIAPSILLILFFSSLTAFALSRFAFKGRSLVFFIYACGIMIPLQLSIIPLIYELKFLNLIDSRLGLIISYTAYGIPFATFLLTFYFKNLPSHYFDSAVIDGAPLLIIYTKILLPLGSPALFTIGILEFIFIWKEYFMAFTLTSGSPDNSIAPLTVGLAKLSYNTQYHADWGIIFASIMIAVIPPLLICPFAQKALFNSNNLQN